MVSKPRTRGWRLRLNGQERVAVLESGGDPVRYCLTALYIFVLTFHLKLPCRLNFKIREGYVDAAESKRSSILNTLVGSRGSQSGEFFRVRGLYYRQYRDACNTAWFHGWTQGVPVGDIGVPYGIKRDHGDHGTLGGS